MRDGNIVIVTKSGQEFRAVRPNRVGLQYDTPWLNTWDRDSDDRSEGSRVWNVDPVEVLEKYQAQRDYSYNAAFIIGPWGTTYKDPNFLYSIPLVTVEGFRELPLEEIPTCEKGCRSGPAHADKCWVPAHGFGEDSGFTHDDYVFMLEDLVRKATTAELLHAWCVLFGEPKVLQAMREYKREAGKTLVYGLQN